LQEIFARVRQQLTELWERQDPKSRRRFLVIAAVCVLIVVVAVSLMARTEWEILLQEMDDYDTGEVIQMLRDRNERFQTGQSPGTIEVPRGNAARLRSDIAFAGGVTSGYAFDIYEMGRGFMSTDQDRRQYMIFQTAMLIRDDLMASALIRDARVTLAIDTSNRVPGIRDEITVPTAAVMLTMAQGVTLNDNQIRGFQNHVAASVPGLQAENVNMVDSYGNPLRSEEPIHTILDEIREFYELAHLLESRWRSNAMAALTGAFGINSVKVAVSIRLNMRTESSERIEFYPVVDGEGIAVSLRTVNEKATAMNPPARVEGIDSNGGAPIYPELDPTQAMNWSSSIMEANYEVTQVLRRIEEERGDVSFASISVTIDNDRSNFDDEFIEDIRRHVANAVGIRDLSLVSILVNPNPDRLISEELMNRALADLERERLYELIRALVPAVLIFIALLIVILQTFGMLRFKPEPVEVTDLLTAEQLEMIGLAVDGTPLPASFDEIDDMMLDEEAQRAKNLREKLEEIIKSNPEMAAELLRNWLSADDHW